MGQKVVIEEFCDWLAATPLSLAFQSANWFVPSVQTVHIIAIAILLISVYVISLKLVGLIRGVQPLATTMAKSTPWIWTALLVLLVTGILLTITEPARELLNWAFRVKMLLVLALAGCVALIQSRLSANPDYWTESAARRWAGRTLGVLVLGLGACIVTAGRWIAYV
jgi:hypothetical protein